MRRNLRSFGISSDGLYLLKIIELYNCLHSQTTLHTEIYNQEVIICDGTTLTTSICVSSSSTPSVNEKPFEKTVSWTFKIHSYLIVPNVG